MTEIIKPEIRLFPRTAIKVINSVTIVNQDDGTFELACPRAGGKEPNKTPEKKLDSGKNFDSVIQPKG